MPVIIVPAGGVKPKFAPGPDLDHAIVSNKGKKDIDENVSQIPRVLVDGLSLVFGAVDADQPKAVFGDLRKQDDDDKLKERLWLDGFSTYKRYTSSFFPLAVHARLPAGHADGQWAVPVTVPGQRKKEALRAFVGLVLKGKKPFARLDFNPSRWSEAQLADLFTRTEDVLLLGEQWPHGRTLADVLHKATITGIDIAVDVPGIRPGDYVWYDRTKAGKKEPTETWYVKNNQLQTLYLGPFHTKQGKAANKFCIYDKAAEAGLSGQRTRVEWRWNKPQASPGKMLAKHNPFLDLQCYDPVLIVNQIGIPSDFRRREIGNFRRGGIAAALAELEEPYRSRLLLALPHCVPSWWRPEEFWARFPAALSRALPVVFPEPMGTVH